MSLRVKKVVLKMENRPFWAEKGGALAAAGGPYSAPEAEVIPLSVLVRPF